MLIKITKESKFAADYMCDILTLDELAVVGSSISNTKLIVKVLSGLKPDYRDISDVIRARDSPISFEELYDKLTYHELFIKHEDAKKPAAPITVQVAQTSGPNNSGPRSHRRWNNHSSQKSSQPHFSFN
uniref:UBN2 domain-containing protein n=1 Tax=Manihot esculenta TaxID=3983 RepID=A0A2C9VMZ8_MANES